MIPDHIKRFLVTRIETIPHLEALLLIRRLRDESWDATRLAREIYIAHDSAVELLHKLDSEGFIEAVEKQDGTFHYAGKNKELDKLLGELESVYTRNLIEVTKLVHATQSEVQKFADAFKFKKG